MKLLKKTFIPTGILLFLIRELPRLVILFLGLKLMRLVVLIIILVKVFLCFYNQSYMPFLWFFGGSVPAYLSYLFLFHSSKRISTSAILPLALLPRPRMCQYHAAQQSAELDSRFQSLAFLISSVFRSRLNFHSYNYLFEADSSQCSFYRYCKSQP